MSAAFAKQVPYVQRVPSTVMMVIIESLIRFPCGQSG